MILIIFFSAVVGIFESLLASKHLPALVIQTFVEFFAGLFSEICTCIGSKGFPSFTQMKTRYEPTLKT